ncbi:MAG: sugar phosphate nucleotidyltransferase [Thermoleophilaceae bacterium]
MVRAPALEQSGTGGRLRAFVLAAGAGSRLRPLTDTLPKPLAPVAGRPVTSHLLDRLDGLDLEAVALNVHHGADLVERCLGPGPHYIREDWLRGTAGALAGAGDFLSGGTFLVASADGVHEIDLAALAARHRASGASATITVKHLAQPESCAIVELDNGIVRRFVEKPAAGEVFSTLASIGVYCFEPEVLELIPHDRPFDIAAELIPALLAGGYPVAAYATDAWWCDVGSPAELLVANLAAARGEVGLRHARQTEGMGEGVRVYERSEVGADARIDAPAAVGPDARVGSGAVVSGALVLPGASVEPGAVVEDAIHGDGHDVVRSWLRG